MVEDHLNENNLQLCFETLMNLTQANNLNTKHKIFLHELIIKITKNLLLRTGDKTSLSIIKYFFFKSHICLVKDLLVKNTVNYKTKMEDLEREIMREE